MKINNILFNIIILINLNACMSTFFEDDSRLCIGENGVYHRCDIADTKVIRGNAAIIGPGQSIEEQQREMSAAAQNQNQYYFKPYAKQNLLSDYVEQMAMRLAQSIDEEPLPKPIAITSFVQFDSTLNRSDILGNQLSELFFVELQQFGLSVIDHKATNFIKVTSTGDFVLSRNSRDLQRMQSFGYVLSGTMLASERGVIVNARIISLSDQRVVASAKGLIPSFVIPQGFAG